MRKEIQRGWGPTPFELYQGVRAPSRKRRGREAEVTLLHYLSQSQTNKIESLGRLGEAGSGDLASHPLKPPRADARQNTAHPRSSAAGRR